MIRFDERVAIVTGAGKGLGRAYSIYLAARGARVVVNNRRLSASEPSSADEVVQAIRQAGGRVVGSHRRPEGAPEGLLALVRARAGAAEVEMFQIGRAHV